MRQVHTRPRNDTPSLLHHYLSELHVNWYLVRNYLNDYPESAAAHDQHGATALYRALYRRIDDYPPFTIIERLIDIYPQAMWIDNPRQCPLKAACWRRAPLSILSRLIRCRPSRPNDVAALLALWNSFKNVFGEGLLSTITKGGREGAGIWMRIGLILQYCTSENNMIESYQSLHAAAATPESSLEIMQFSFASFPEQIRQKDFQGMLPLHYLVLARDGAQERANLHVKKLDMLLDVYPEAANVRDSQSDRLPIHMAVAHGQEWESIEPLLRAHDVLSQLDTKTGLYPFQLAACTESCSISVVFKLVRAAPYLVMDGMQARAGSLASPGVDLDDSPFNSCCDIYIQRTTRKMMQLATESQDPDFCDDVQKLLSYRIPNTEWLAVHAAVSLPDCPVGLLELVVSFQPHQPAQRDAKNNLPLHLLLSHDRLPDKIVQAYVHDDKDDVEEDICASRVKAVLKHYPDAAKHPDPAGRLPLHAAICVGHPWSSLIELLRAHPSAICQRDQGLYPFQFAASNKCSGLSEVYQLLREAPHLLMDPKP